MKSEGTPHVHSEHCDCGDANCSHHHHHSPEDAARATVENALKYSAKKDIALESSAALSEIEATVRSILLVVAEKVAVDGIVLGHIKAVIKTEYGSCAISITKANCADAQYIGAWEEHKVVNQYSLTVNVLSMANTQLDVEAVLSAL